MSRRVIKETPVVETVEANEVKEMEVQAPVSEETKAPEEPKTEPEPKKEGNKLKAVLRKTVDVVTSPRVRSAAKTCATSVLKGIGYTAGVIATGYAAASVLTKSLKAVEASDPAQIEDQDLLEYSEFTELETSITEEVSTVDEIGEE